MEAHLEHSNISPAWVPVDALFGSDDAADGAAVEEVDPVRSKLTRGMEAVNIFNTRKGESKIFKFRPPVPVSAAALLHCQRHTDCPESKAAHAAILTSSQLVETTKSASHAALHESLWRTGIADCGRDDDPAGPDEWDENVVRWVPCGVSFKPNDTEKPYTSTHNGRLLSNIAKIPTCAVEIPIRSGKPWSLTVNSKTADGNPYNRPIGSSHHKLRIVGQRYNVMHSGEKNRTTRLEDRVGISVDSVVAEEQRGQEGDAPLSAEASLLGVEYRSRPPRPKTTGRNIRRRRPVIDSDSDQEDDPVIPPPQTVESDTHRAPMSPPPTIPAGDDTRPGWEKSFDYFVEHVLDAPEAESMLKREFRQSCGACNGWDMLYPDADDPVAAKKGYFKSQDCKDMIASVHSHGMYIHPGTDGSCHRAYAKDTAGQERTSYACSNPTCNALCSALSGVEDAWPWKKSSSTATLEPFCNPGCKAMTIANLISQMYDDWYELVDSQESGRAPSFSIASSSVAGFDRLGLASRSGSGSNHGSTAYVPPYKRQRSDRNQTSRGG